MSAREGMMSVLDLCLKQGADVTMRTSAPTSTQPRTPSSRQQRHDAATADSPTWVNPQEWVSPISKRPPRSPAPANAMQTCQASAASLSPASGEGYGLSFRRATEEASSLGTGSQRGEEDAGKPGKPGLGVGTDALMAASLGGHVEIVEASRALLEGGVA